MMSTSVADEKALVLLQRRLRLFHAPNLGPAWACSQDSSQLGKLRGISRRVHLDVAIVQIANPSGQPQGIRGVLDVVTETDSLHSPPHSIQPR